MKTLAKCNDARSPDALRRLLGQGAKLAFFPKGSAGCGLQGVA